MKFLITGLFLLSLVSPVLSEESKDDSLFIPELDSRLEVRTKFPSYRVYYNIQKTSDEVRESLKVEQEEETKSSFRKDEN